MTSTFNCKHAFLSQSQNQLSSTLLILSGIFRMVLASLKLKMSLIVSSSHCNLARNMREEIGIRGVNEPSRALNI